MLLSALERLRLFLRPPGKGIYTPSTGGGYATRLLTQLYGTSDAKEVSVAWENGLQKLRRVRGVVLGIPSDTGAGIMRGANFGPIGVREAYLEKYGNYPKDVLDVGDVIVVPQLLHDEMLSESQIKATKESLFPGVNGALPVSPLSIAEAAYAALRELNPNLEVYLIGGDHSVTWPAIVDCEKRFHDNFAVLHFDAHTDLMEHRLGVKYCFGTWAYLAQKIMKPRSLVQVGVRTSGKPKEHWEKTYPVTQFWAKEIVGNEDRAIQNILAHFKKIQAKHIYISNDIDGTDSGLAPATGTPEINGLTAEFVGELISKVKSNFKVIGGDVVEVAPILSGRRDFKNEETCVLAADYLHTLMQ